MKKIIVFLMITGALTLVGCTAHNDEVLAKIDELEQRVALLEQQLEPEYTTPEATPQATETPVIVEPPTAPPTMEDDPAAYFMSIVPDSFIPFADESSIMDASVMKEYDLYGITMHYSVDANADNSIIEDYFYNVMGSDADFGEVNMGHGALFTSEAGDVYYAGLDPMGENVMSVYIEVQFSDADFSDILSDPYADVSNYYLDEIFDKSPTMVKISIVKGDYMDKGFYYEYKYEDMDYDAKIKQVYAQHNIGILAEDESEIIYNFAEGIEVHFDLYDGSNRVNAAVTYYK